MKTVRIDYDGGLFEMYTAEEYSKLQEIKLQENRPHKTSLIRHSGILATRKMKIERVKCTGGNYGN